MIFGPVLWMIDLGLLVAGLIWLVRGGDGTSSQRKASGGQSELDMRFARGEIDS
jgi:putative membrane protein